MVGSSLLEIRQISTCCLIVFFYIEELVLHLTVYFLQSSISQNVKNTEAVDGELAKLNDKKHIRKRNHSGNKQVNYEPRCICQILLVRALNYCCRDLQHLHMLRESRDMQNTS